MTPAPPPGPPPHYKTIGQRVSLEGGSRHQAATTSCTIYRLCRTMVEIERWKELAGMPSLAQGKHVRSTKVSPSWHTSPKGWENGRVSARKRLQPLGSERGDNKFPATLLTPPVSEPDGCRHAARWVDEEDLSSVPWEVGQGRAWNG